MRGGWGIYYSHYSGNIPGDAVGRAVLGHHGEHQQHRQRPGRVHAGRSVRDRRARPGTLALAAVAPHLLNSYAQQYTLSLEHALTRDLGLRVSYIGSKGTQLPTAATSTSRSLRPWRLTTRAGPIPRYATSSMPTTARTCSTAACRRRCNKRFSNGLMFTSTWTWAKELSDTDDTGDFELNTPIENTYDRRRDRGNVYSVPRHQWMNQALYEMPLGRASCSAAGR